MCVKAFGTFKAFNQTIFRTQAYLQWGNSDETIGLIIMLNPGSSSLENNRDWDSFLKRNHNGENFSQSGELKLDPTMESVNYILSTVYPNLEGKLLIYNLFNLRSGNSNEAIQTYSTLINDSRYQPYLHTDLPDLHDIPWVWTAWSVISHSSINSRKKEILKQTAAQKRIAVYSTQKNHQSNRTLYCYHPYPQIQQQRLWIQNETIKEFEKLYG